MTLDDQVLITLWIRNRRLDNVRRRILRRTKAGAAVQGGHLNNKNATKAKGVQERREGVSETQTEHIRP